MLCEGVQPGQIDAPSCSARHAPNGAARCGLPKIADGGQHSRRDGGLAWCPAIDGCGDPPNLSGVQGRRASRLVYGFEVAGQFVKVAHAIMETTGDASQRAVSAPLRDRPTILRCWTRATAILGVGDGPRRLSQGFEQPLRGVGQRKIVQNLICPLCNRGRCDDIAPVALHFQPRSNGIIPCARLHIVARVLVEILPSVPSGLNRPGLCYGAVLGFYVLTTYGAHLVRVVVQGDDPASLPGRDTDIRARPTSPPCRDLARVRRGVFEAVSSAGVLARRALRIDL